MTRKDMIDRFTEVVGRERAQELVDDAIRKQGWIGRETFNKDDTITLCEHLKQGEQLVRIVAGCLISQALLRS